MAEQGTRIRRTRSVCPVCLRQIPAERVLRDGAIYLEKRCPEHGDFSAVVWRGREDFQGWIGGLPEIGEGENQNCPAACGLCPEHKRDTCCVLLEITDRCDLRCRYCFADNRYTRDPPLETVKAWLRDLAVPGKTLVQLSGGEPTVREDLPEIIACAKEAGCRYVQLNTNGVRLAEEEGYAERLAAAGLSFVFLQFDGTNDDVWTAMRGRPMAELKERAIENCGKSRLGVTLVPTLVPGINIAEIGPILRYAIRRSPTVRGVHFQPVSYMGRIPALPRDEDRFTLDELIAELLRQSDGLIQGENIAPSSCDHPLCGFHGDFVVMPDGSLMPLTHRQTAGEGCCCGTPSADPAALNRQFVGKRWERRDKDGPEGTDMSDMGQFLDRVLKYGFTVTAMAFQDAGNLDIERLRQCSLHVYREGKIIPFCARYLTPLE